MMRKIIIPVFLIGVIALTATQFIPQDINNTSFEPYSKKFNTSLIRLGMQCVISMVLLISSLFVILSKKLYTPQDRHWDYGMVGTILGFWLKGT
jgi:hypothetical protein